MTQRGVPLNAYAVAVLQEQMGKHNQFCFTYLNQPILRGLTNPAWMNAVKKVGLEGLRLHDQGSNLGQTD